MEKEYWCIIRLWRNNKSKNKSWIKLLRVQCLRFWILFRVCQVSMKWKMSRKEATTICRRPKAQLSLILEQVLASLSSTRPSKPDVKVLVSKLCLRALFSARIKSGNSKTTTKRNWFNLNQLRIFKSQALTSDHRKNKRNNCLLFRKVFDKRVKNYLAAKLWRKSTLKIFNNCKTKYARSSKQLKAVPPLPKVNVIEWVKTTSLTTSQRLGSI